MRNNESTKSNSSGRNYYQSFPTDSSIPSIHRREKQQLEIKLAEIIQEQLSVIRRDSIIELKKTMDTMSQSAQYRGLTLEILDAILNDE